MTHGPQRHAGAALAAAPAPVSDLRGDDAPPDVATATRRWFDAWTPPELPVDRLPLHLAIGRVAAQALRAHVANPAHDLAAMDGIVVTTAAIQRDGALPAGGYDLIDTGDPVPPGRDAVVPSEQLEYGPDRTIHLVAAVPPGRHIRSAGEDVAEEELLVAAGHRLRPVDAAVLASAGYDEVPVMARPRVTVIPTGDEIRPAGTIPVRGEIVDSNSTLIAGTLAAHGAEVAVTEIVPDQPELLASRIRATAIRSDLIMVIAGSSAGRDDHTAAVVRAVGRVVVHHLPLRPGHPVLLGTAHERPVIGVPGYPVAAARVTDLFAVPALARMDHRAIPRDRALVAVLGAPLASSPHTDEQVPVRLRDDVSGPPVAEPMQRGGRLPDLVDAGGRSGAPTSGLCRMGRRPYRSRSRCGRLCYRAATPRGATVMCYTVKSIDDVRSLVAAARGLAGLVDVDTLCSRACRRLRELVGEDAALIAVCEQPDVLTVAAVDGVPQPGPGRGSRRGRGLGWLAIDLDDTPTARLLGDGTVLLEDTPTAVLDGGLVERLGDDPVLGVAAASGLRSVMACPVEFAGAALGAIYVARRGDQRLDLRVAELLWEFAASLAPLMVTALNASRAGEIAAQEERARIAQQLHDTAGQILYSISLSAQDLRRSAGATDSLDTESIVTSAKRIEYEATQASACLRQAMHTLLPPGEALPVTLRRDAAAFSRRSGIPAEAIVLGAPVESSDLVDETIIAAVREGLHNVERHAGASSVSITLTYRPLDLALMVQDDGIGLGERPSITPLPGKARGLGIPGLQQRVRAIGGDLSLRDGEEGGAGLLITLPLGDTR